MHFRKYARRSFTPAIQRLQWKSHKQWIIITVCGLIAGTLNANLLSSISYFRIVFRITQTCESNPVFTTHFMWSVTSFNLSPHRIFNRFHSIRLQSNRFAALNHACIHIVQSRNKTSNWLCKRENSSRFYSHRHMRYDFLAHSVEQSCSTAFEVKLKYNAILNLVQSQPNYYVNKSFEKFAGILEREGMKNPVKSRKMAIEGICF